MAFYISHIPHSFACIIATWTQTQQARSVSASEAISLKGFVDLIIPSHISSHFFPRHRAKTPIIAGSICGFFLILGWTVALISCLVRRRKEKIRDKKVAAGLKAPRPVVQPPEKYIIPPDPAVVLGQRQPGEHVVVEERKHRFGHVKHPKTMSPPRESEEIRDGPLLHHGSTESFSGHNDHHTNGTMNP